MRNKTARELCQIIPYLLSPDIESILLGFTLFKETPLFKNLSKHYRSSKIYASWPSWSEYCPAHLKALGNNYRAEVRFSKSLLDLKEPLKEEKQYYRLALITFKWIYDQVHYSQKKFIRYQSKTLFHDMEENLTGELIVTQHFHQKQHEWHAHKSINSKINLDLHYIAQQYPDLKTLIYEIKKAGNYCFLNNIYSNQF